MNPSTLMDHSLKIQAGVVRQVDVPSEVELGLGEPCTRVLLEKEQLGQREN